MRVAVLFADRPYAQKQQDMLSACMFVGLVNAFGSTNVRDFPPSEPQYHGGPEYEVEWPLWLGAGCLKGKPLATFNLGEADAYFVSTCWILNSVQSGFRSDAEQKEMITQIDPSRTILIDPSDSPSIVGLLKCDKMLGGSAIHVTRPCMSKDHHFNAHIAVPREHYLRMRAAYTGPSPWKTPTIFAGWNDNDPFRRDVMMALARSNLPNKTLLWGSAAQYEITGTTGPFSPPLYYATMERSQICVSCRGGNRDCLRTSEILMLGRLMISDDPMWDPTLTDGVHYLKAETPEEFVSKCWWALDHPKEAADIARIGQAFFLGTHTCEQQAFRLLQKAGLLT